MKIKDLKEDVLIKDIKVKLPDLLYEGSSLTNKYYGIGREVWLVGPMMGDWFVKKNREDTKVYPLFIAYIPTEEIQDLEVIEVYKE